MMKTNSKAIKERKPGTIFLEGLMIFAVASAVFILAHLISNEIKKNRADKLIYSENNAEVYYDRRNKECIVYEDGAELIAPYPETGEAKVISVEVYDHVIVEEFSEPTWENNPEYYRVYLREQKRWLTSPFGGSTFLTFIIDRDKIELERGGEPWVVYNFNAKTIFLQKH